MGEGITMDANTFFDEIAWFAEPLVEAADSEDKLVKFFRLFGYDLKAGDTGSIITGFESLATAVEGLVEENAPAEEDPDLEKLLEVFSVVKSIGDTASLTNYFGPDFFVEVFDYLLYKYLSVKRPGLLTFLSILGVLKIEDIPDARDLPYSKISFNWGRISDFVSDTSGWAKEVYGWGGNTSAGDPKSLDYKFLFSNLAAMFEAAGLSLAIFKKVSPAELSGFLSNFNPADDHYQVSLSLIQENPIGLDADNDPIFGTEAGFKLLPYGDMNQQQNLGFALAPFVTGTIAETIPLTENLDVIVNISVDALGGIFLTISPQGVSLQSGGSINAGFETGVKYFDRANNQPLPVISFGGASKIDIKSASVMIGGDLHGDFYLKGGVEQLRALIDLGQDGLMKNFISDPIEIMVGDITATWKFGKGVYIDGGNNVAISIPIHLDLGPIKVSKISLELGLLEKTSLALGVSAGFSLGPIAANVENIGVKAILSENAQNNGLLGKFDLDFAFKPPNGIGLAIDAGVVKGGGYLFIDAERGEYAGVLELTFQDFLSLKAIGLISTKMPDGSDGFSLLVIITAEFTIQLGYGFVFLGAGGLLGLHRTMKLEPLAEGIRTGATANIMFPTNVIENAPQIISDLKEFFPIGQDKFLIGPMAKLGWGTPTLISISLGIIIEIRTNEGGGIERIAILGVLKCILPTEEAALLKLQVNFIGAIDFQKKTAFFFASIFDSRVLFITIEGEMGVLIAWGDDSNFVVSVGGFHPQFNPPPLPFPVPKRVALNILNESWGKIRVEGYFAVTSNTAQFGCKVELMFGFSEFKIEGHLAFDALFQFNPFYFIIEISGKVSLKVFGAGLFSISLQLSLEGTSPWRAKGYGKIKILFITFKARFDESWGEKENTELPPIKIIPILLEELGKPTNWQALAPASNNLLVTLREIPEAEEGEEETLVLHPVGSIRISQRALPLKITLDKVGSKKPEDAKVLDFAPVGSFAAKSDIKENFARAQYQEMKDSKKLSSPAYEKETGGYEISFNDSQTKFGRLTVRHVRYELITIDTAYKRYRQRFYKLWKSLFAAFVGNSAVAKTDLSFKVQKEFRPFEEKIEIIGGRYTVANTRNNTPLREEAINFASQASADEYLNSLIDRDPAMAGSVHVIPNHEVNSLS